jgi:NAD(P)-dependent dehydrogenase (short-subunit alcohol dehydrogenase family)
MTLNDRLFGLTGRVAAVIGGGGYLCSEMARGLSAAGCAVAVLDRDAAKAEHVASEITAATGRAFGHPIDVTSRTSQETALSAVLSRYQRVDILINGAGINAPTPFFDITQEEWHSILDVHLKGTFLACQVFGASMLEKGRGTIINLSSASSGPPLSKAFTYSVAKAGIKNLTMNLAREWATQGVRVNALRPGFFPTDWSREHFITPDRERAILGHTPMGRYGRPEELVSAVIWLASDGASFVTGAEIPVDGGFSCMTI